MIVIHDDPDRPFTGPSLENGTICALGNFDGVHAGHRLLLRKNSELSQALHSGGKTPLRAAVTFSPHPRSLLEPGTFKTIYTEQERAELIGQTGWVDVLLIVRFSRDFMNLSPREFFDTILVRRYAARAITVGDDYHFGSKAAGTAEMLREMAQEHGLYCQIVPRLQAAGAPVSSSRIRQALEKGDIRLADQLLASGYFIEGTVMEGKHEGRRLSAPTVNIPLDPSLVEPRYGVYTCRVFTKDKAYPAVCNVGDNPTFGHESPRLEAFLFGYQGNLYGQHLKAQLLEFQRPQQKFPGPEALRAQLEKDIQKARQFFGLDL